MIPTPPTLFTAAAHLDPYPFYADLLARAPFAYDDALGLWVAASVAVVQTVLTHPHARVRPPDEAVPSALLDTSVAPIYRLLIRQRDDPARQPLKDAIGAHLHSLNPAFVTERASALAHQLDAAEQGHAPARLSEFILRLPVAVVASLLGTPEADIPLVTAWLRDLVGCLQHGADEGTWSRGGVAAGQLRGYVGELLKLRWPTAGAEDNGGLNLTRLGAALEPGDRDAVVANAIGLLVQSYEATAGLIGNTLLALVAHPHLRERAEDDAALWAIGREVLRFDPPIHNTRRYLGHDVQIAGQHVRAGDAVVVVLAAANRDLTANPNPNRFDPCRAAPRCFTFGVGAHACPGELLALAIAAAGVRHVLSGGLDLDQLAAVAYRPLVNARVPVFGSRSSSTHAGTGGKRP